MDNYKINDDTLLIVPFKKGKSKVYECNKEFIVNMTSLNIIKKSCIYYGSSFEGRKEATKSILSIDMKVPILIEDSNNIIFFPASSCINKSSIWVSYLNLWKYEKTNDSCTILYFKDNRKVVIECKYNLIDNQFNRCMKLSILLTKRKDLFSD